MDRVLGSENIARVCEGLSHPIRAEIMDMLLTKGVMGFGDIILELKRRGYGDASNSMVRHHTMIMGFCGLVELHRDKVYSVKPLYRVDIYMEKI